MYSSQIDVTPTARLVTPGYSLTVTAVPVKVETNEAPIADWDPHTFSGDPESLDPPSLHSLQSPSQRVWIRLID